MDDYPADYNELFKAAAREASRASARLDPSEANERGTKRRRLARLRRRASAVFIVLLVGAAIVVPLPQLHLLHSTGRGPAGGGRHNSRPTLPTSIGSQLAELKVSGPIAVSGTTAVIGAPAAAEDAGRAYVFTETAAGWQQIAVLRGSDTIAPDNFGVSVAISGATAVVGALGRREGDGRAYIFAETAAGWEQVAELKGLRQLPTVAISGTTAVVGTEGGPVYVFTKTVAGWTQVDELKGPFRGPEIAISGSTFVLTIDGSPSAEVFTLAATGWKQVAELNAPAGYEILSVAISGATAVIGTYRRSMRVRPPYPPGSAFVFDRTAAGWTRVAELKGADDSFGEAVAISGTTVVVGDLGFGGRAFVFTKTAAGWAQATVLKVSGTTPPDEFGEWVAVSGTTAFVGTTSRVYVFRA